MQATISGIGEQLDRNDCGTMRNVAACRAVLHDCIAELCCTLPGRNGLVIGFEPEAVVIELE